MPSLPSRHGVSPTLSQIRSKTETAQLCADVACHDCPLAVWYATSESVEDLRCFCSALHREVWSAERSKNGEEVKLCDAREGAIAELALPR